MNYLDFAIIFAFIIFILIGLWRGFLNEILTFLGFIVSIILSFFLYSALGQKIYEEFNIPSGLSNLISFVFIFLILQIIWSLSSGIIYRKIYIKWRNWSNFRIIEKVLGSIVGFLNGFVLIALILISLVVIPVNPRVKSELTNAKLVPFFINKTAVLNNIIEQLFIPAAKEAEARLRNLTTSITPEGQSELSFPDNLELAPNSQAEIRMLDLINVERTQRGLRALEMDEGLRKVARAHSEEMFKLSYFDHVSPVTGTPFDRLDRAEIAYQLAGENIAYAPNVDVAHYGLMNSPPHKENILESKYGKVGIGIISAGPWGEMYTQEFTD